VPTTEAGGESFNQLKAWRGIATRYDKHATVFHGAVVLASILLWLRH
jgi:transposase